jgi:outer membrane protein insertion porin family/translocation and assembly module TamA
LLVPAALVATMACHAEGDIEVTGIDFAGVEAIDESQLRRVLATRQSARLPWGQKHYFDRERVQADVKRLEAVYEQRGFPDATVTLEVALNDAQDEVRITFTVAEGQPYVVEGLEFRGFDVLPAGRFDELRERVPLREGQPRDLQLVQVIRDMAVGELRDYGYPYARVEAAEVATAERAVVLTFTAVPGTIATYGPIEIQGNRSVGDEVIRRQITYRPGELFRLTELQETQRRLYGLELFQFANVEAIGTESQSPQVPTRVTVAEGDHRRVELGFGYGTEEKVRGQIEYRHLNFLGGARTAGARAKWSSLDRGVRVDFSEPHLFTNRLAFGANAQYWFAREPAYRLDSRGGRATVTHRVARRGPLVRDRTTTNTLSVSFINEVEDYAITNEYLANLGFRDELIALGLDPRTGVGSGTLVALAFDAERNTTDNLLDARSGYVASAHVEYAGRALLPGTFNYVEFSTEGRHYLTVAGRAILASRLRFGAIDGREVGDVPFFKRFFLGGSTSLRGWGRYEVAPLSASGLPLGGFTTLELTGELRIPISGNIGLVLFVDAGNVWPRSWDVDFGDLRYDAGPGLRYQTPVGPVRFDFGYQLTPIDGLLVNGSPEKRRWRMHFSIGQAF